MIIKKLIKKYKQSLFNGVPRTEHVDHLDRSLFNLSFIKFLNVFYYFYNIIILPSQHTK